MFIAVIQIISIVAQTSRAMLDFKFWYDAET